MWFFFIVSKPELRHRNLFTEVVTIFQPRTRRDSIVLLWSLFIRRFSVRLLASITTLFSTVILFIFLLYSDLLPDPDCFLSISSLARDHANAIYLSYFRRYGIVRSFLSQFSVIFLHFLIGEKWFSLRPFGSRFCSHFCSLTHTKHSDKPSRSAYYGYLFLFSFLSLAHFNIPPINRSASPNPPVSYYPHLNFVQNALFFSLDYVLSNFQACKHAWALWIRSHPLAKASFFFSVFFFISHLSATPSVPIVMFLSTAVLWFFLSLTLTAPLFGTFFLFLSFLSSRRIFEYVIVLTPFICLTFSPVYQLFSVW